jgi:hypothetical protein
LKLEMNTFAAGFCLCATAVLASKGEWHFATIVGLLTILNLIGSVKGRA